MNKTNFALLIYGIILIVGGLMGYHYANSFASLFSGTIAGALAVILSFLMMAKKPYVDFFAFGLTAVLTIVFALRFSKSFSFFMILLTLFSGYITILLALKAFKLNRHD